MRVILASEDRRMKNLVTVALLLLVFSIFASSQSQNGPDVHFSQQRFQIPFKGSLTIALPRKYSIVRVEVAITNIITATDFHPMRANDPMILSLVTAIDTHTGVAAFVISPNGSTDEDGIHGNVISNRNGTLTISTREV